MKRGHFCIDGGPFASKQKARGLYTICFDAKGPRNPSASRGPYLHRDTGRGHTDKLIFKNGAAPVQHFSATFFSKTLCSPFWVFEHMLLAHPGARVRTAFPILSQVEKFLDPFCQVHCHLRRCRRIVQSRFGLIQS